MAVGPDLEALSAAGCEAEAEQFRNVLRALLARKASAADDMAEGTEEEGTEEEGTEEEGTEEEETEDYNSA